MKTIVSMLIGAACATSWWIVAIYGERFAVIPIVPTVLCIALFAYEAIRLWDK